MEEPESSSISTSEANYQALSISTSEANYRASRASVVGWAAKLAEEPRLEGKLSGYKVTGYGVFLGRPSLLRPGERTRIHYYRICLNRCNLVTP